VYAAAWDAFVSLDGVSVPVTFPGVGKSDVRWSVFWLTVHRVMHVFPGFLPVTAAHSRECMRSPFTVAGTAADKAQCLLRSRSRPNGHQRIVVMGCSILLVSP
jgi:hypothetical protein